MTSQRWKSGHVIANRIKIHYRRTGDDKPPVVLAHGITDNGLCWTHLARELEQDYDVIMYDARGHGLSEHPEEGYAYETQAADLAELIQALDLKTPRLIGHSLGAFTVAVTAANWPGLVRCAVLEDPPWFPDAFDPFSEERAADDEEWRADILALKSQSREAIIAHCRTENPRWSEAECGPWADSKLQVSLNVFKLFTTPQPSWSDTVRRIKCPVLLITGDPEMGAIVAPEIAREAAALMQNGRVAHISGAGHCIRREQPDQYLGAVTAFLQEVS